MNPNTDFIQNLFEKLSNLKNKKRLITDENKRAKNVKELKSAPSSTTKTPEGGKTPSSPGTPQVVDTKPAKELKESKSDTGKSETSTFSEKIDNKSTNRSKEIKQENKKIPEKENQAGEVEEQAGKVGVGQNGEVEKRTDQIAGEVGRKESETRGEFVHKNQKAQAGENLFSVTKNQLLDLQKQEKAQRKEWLKNMLETQEGLEVKNFLKEFLPKINKGIGKHVHAQFV